MTNRRWNSTRTTNQQKAQISFKIIRLSKKALSKVLYNYEDQDKKLSEFPTLESTREIFIKEISFWCLFVVDKKVNPFSVDQKLCDQNKYEMIYKLWKEYIPLDFDKFICREEDFLYLNNKNVLYTKIAELVWKFTTEYYKNYSKPSITCSSLRKIFSMSMQLSFPKSIVQPNVEVSIWKPHFS